MSPNDPSSSTSDTTATRRTVGSVESNSAERWRLLHERLLRSDAASKLGVAPDVDREKEILHARAKALAARPAEAEDPSMYIEVVEFMLATERYAIESTYVREVYPLKDVTPLPGLPPSLLGVMNVRGHILPVVDIKRLFDLPEGEQSLSGRVLVLGDDDSGVGLYADKIIGVHSVRRSTMQVSLPTLTGIRVDLLKAISDDRLVILDGVKLLLDPRLGGGEEA